VTLQRPGRSLRAGLLGEGAPAPKAVSSSPRRIRLVADHRTPKRLRRETHEDGGRSWRFAREVHRRKIPPMKPENPTIEICPGITRRTVAHGENMYQMLATLAAGSKMPAHSHPQEQIVHILEGKMRLIVEGVPHELSTGESFYLASNVSHGVETLSATRVLDTFSPPRTDYLAMDQKIFHGAL
jgi:unsaturated pyranuronate lyase